MKGGTRQLILFVCVTAVVLADRLGVLEEKPNISVVYRATNMSRYITLRDKQHHRWLRGWNPLNTKLQCCEQDEYQINEVTDSIHGTYEQH